MKTMTDYLRADIKCPNCGYEGKRDSITKGSFWVEIFLWSLGILTFGILLIPAIIYSLWRLMSRYKGCPRCRYEFIFRKEK